jgi:hypothetical protein
MYTVLLYVHNIYFIYCICMFGYIHDKYVDEEHTHRYFTTDLLYEDKILLLLCTLCVQYRVSKS